MVYTGDLKSPALTGMPVRVRLRAPFFKIQWSYRLSVRTRGFHPLERGSTPRSSSI